MTATTPIRCTVPIFYASTEGQTRRIAERLAGTLQSAGHDSRPIDLSSSEANAIDWTHVRGVVLAASLHGGTHQRSARAFVRAHTLELNARPSMFVSVSLSAASQYEDEVDAARRIANEFPSVNGWTPTVIASVAGRLAYTQYGFLKRMILKRIARHEGAPMDTSRDWEFTNWDRVEELGRNLAATIALRRAA